MCSASIAILAVIRKSGVFCRRAETKSQVDLARIGGNIVQYDVQKRSSLEKMVYGSKDHVIGN